MTKIVLDEPQIMPVIGEIIAARVPQHVRPDRRQAGARCRTRNEVIHGLPAERLPALGNEQPGELVCASGEVSFDRSDFVASDRLLYGEAVLEPSYPEPGLPKIHLIAPQSDHLADLQAVAIHHQHQQTIAHAVAPGLGGLEQCRDLRLGQEILGPFVPVGSLRGTTFDTLPFGRRPPHGECPASGGMRTAAI